MSEKEDLIIRAATEDDTAVILDFIRSLATYEKLLHEVSADEEGLRKNLFERQAAEVLLAESMGSPAGFALFFHNFSTFLGMPGIYIEDLFVHPEFRGRGIGARLLAAIAALAVERGCGRLEWAVLDWNEPAMRFYRRLGAGSRDEWKLFRLTGSSLLELAGTTPLPGE